jgi:hypothetical protein
VRRGGQEEVTGNIRSSSGDHGDVLVGRESDTVDVDRMPAARQRAVVVEDGYPRVADRSFDVPTAVGAEHLGDLARNDLDHGGRGYVALGDGACGAEDSVEIAGNAARPAPAAGVGIAGCGGDPDPSVAPEPTASTTSVTPSEAVTSASSTGSTEVPSSPPSAGDWPLELGAGRPPDGWGLGSRKADEATSVTDLWVFRLCEPTPEPTEHGFEEAGHGWCYEDRGRTTSTPVAGWFPALWRSMMRGPRPRTLLTWACLGLAAVAYRRCHLRWGATSDEVGASMPGDDLVPCSQFAATRAITIDAPAEHVWPWIVQVGFGRAGFYSYDLLDNLGRDSSDKVMPELQDPQVGDMAAPMASPPTPSTSFTVVQVAKPHRLVWAKPDSTWAWKLDSLPGQRTRLVTRLRQAYRPGPGLLITVPLAEIGDFPMMRRMLLGIRDRAEHQSAVQPDMSLVTQS